MFSDKNFNQLALLLLLSLGAGCGNYTGPLLVTPQTSLNYPYVTVNDLTGASGRTPADKNCYESLKRSPFYSERIDKCDFAGDVIILGELLSLPESEGRTTRRMDPNDKSQGYLVRVLHVFSGVYQEKEILLMNIPYPLDDKPGDIMLFSAFYLNGHWRVNTVIPTRPDDYSPYTINSAPLPISLCPVVALPDKVGELDVWLQGITDKKRYDKMCPNRSTWEKQKQWAFKE